MDLKRLLRRTPLLAGMALLLAMPAREAEAKKDVTVPVDIGIGPSFTMGTGTLFRDQPGFYGLKLSLAAIIDQKTIRENINKVPKKFRNMAKKIDEIRYRPSLLIPDHFVISPQLDDTGIGMYGVTWRPVSLGVPIIKRGVRLTLGVGLLFTYSFLHWNADQRPELAANTMHFLRPGLDGGLNLEIPFSERFLISVGWFAQAYVPQQMGRGPASGFDTYSERLTENPGAFVWFFHQAYLRFHFRFPYTVRM